MLNVELNSYFTEPYADNLGQPTGHTKSRMDATARVMARGVLTDWGVSEDPEDCPTEKYVTTYKPRAIGTWWKIWQAAKNKRKDLSTGCTVDKRAMNQLSTNEVRSPLSPNQSSCNSLLAAYALAEGDDGQKATAQGRLDGCGMWARTCKRRAKIDIAKWETVGTQLNTYYSAGGTDYLDCTSQTINDGQQQTLDILNALIEQRDQDPGIDNTSLLMTIGVGIIGLTYITLKMIK